MEDQTLSVSWSTATADPLADIAAAAKALMVESRRVSEDLVKQGKAMKSRAGMLAAVAMAACAGYPVASPARNVAPATGSNGTPYQHISGTDPPKPPGFVQQRERRAHRHMRRR